MTPQERYLTSTFSGIQLEHQLGNMKTYLQMCGSDLERQVSVLQKSKLKGAKRATAIAKALATLDEQLEPLSIEALRQQPIRPLIQHQLRVRQVDFSTVGASAGDLMQELERQEASTTTKKRKTKSGSTKEKSSTGGKAGKKAADEKGPCAQPEELDEEGPAQPNKEGRKTRKATKQQKSVHFEEKNRAQERVRDVWGIRQARGKKHYLVEWEAECVQEGEEDQSWETHDRLRGVRGFKDALREYFHRVERQQAEAAEEVSDTEEDADEEEEVKKKRNCFSKKGNIDIHN